MVIGNLHGQFWSPGLWDVWNQQITAIHRWAASCVGIIEDLIQFGMEKLVLFGTCGVLNRDIEATSIIIQRLLFTTGDQLPLSSTASSDEVK